MNFKEVFLRGLIQNLVFNCFDSNCMTPGHKSEMLQWIFCSARKSRPNFKAVRCWNSEIKQINANAREKLFKWKMNGKPLVGQVYRWTRYLDPHLHMKIYARFLTSATASASPIIEN